MKWTWRVRKIRPRSGGSHSNYSCLTEAGQIIEPRKRSGPILNSNWLSAPLSLRSTCPLAQRHVLSRGLLRPTRSLLLAHCSQPGWSCRFHAQLASYDSRATLFSPATICEARLERSCGFGLHSSPGKSRQCGQSINVSRRASVECYYWRAMD